MAQDFLINATGSGDTTLIPAGNLGTRSFIRVLHYHVTADRPVTVQFRSSGGTVKDIVYGTQASGGGIATPEYPTGIFDLPNGEGLVINLSAGANVGGAGKFTVKGPGAWDS